MLSSFIRTSNDAPSASFEVLWKSNNFFIVLTETRALPWNNGNPRLLCTTVKILGLCGFFSLLVIVLHLNRLFGLGFGFHLERRENWSSIYC